MLSVLFLLPDVAADALDEHIEGDEVMPALQHDDIRPALAGLDILLVHRLDGGDWFTTDSRVRPRSRTSRTMRRRMRSSASVSTKILMSISLASSSSAKMRMPSTMMTLVGCTSSVRSVRLWME